MQHNGDVSPEIIYNVVHTVGFFFLNGTHTLDKLVRCSMTHPWQFCHCIYTYIALYEYGQPVQRNVEAIHCDIHYCYYRSTGRLCSTNHHLYILEVRIRKSKQTNILRSTLTAITPGTIGTGSDGHLFKFKTYLRQQDSQHSC
jgi:hypothetical protein